MSSTRPKWFVTMGGVRVIAHHLFADEVVEEGGVRHEGTPGTVLVRIGGQQAILPQAMFDALFKGPTPYEAEVTISPVTVTVYGGGEEPLHRNEIHPAERRMVDAISPYLGRRPRLEELTRQLNEAMREPGPDGTVWSQEARDRAMRDLPEHPNIVYRHGV